MPPELCVALWRPRLAARQAQLRQTMDRARKARAARRGHACRLVTATPRITRAAHAQANDCSQRCRAERDGPPGVGHDAPHGEKPWICPSKRSSSTGTPAPAAPWRRLRLHRTSGSKPAVMKGPAAGPAGSPPAAARRANRLVGVRLAQIVVDEPLHARSRQRQLLGVPLERWPVAWRMSVPG